MKTSLKVAVVLVLAAATLVTVGLATNGSSPSPLPADGPPAPVRRIAGWLHTDGTRILDAHGTPTRLVGVNIDGMVCGTGAPASSLDTRLSGWIAPTAQQARNVASWGFNVVRLPISWSNIEPTPPSPGPGGTVVHHWNAAYLTALDRTIALFSAEDVRVVLDMHHYHWSPAVVFRVRGAPGLLRGCGMPTWVVSPSGELLSEADAKSAFFGNPAAWDGLAAVWKMLAARYARSSDVVGVDLINEPYAYPGQLPAADLHLPQIYERVGQAIRSVNPRVVIFFEDNTVAANVGFSLREPPPFGNVCYSAHVYAPTYDEAIRQLGTYLERANAWHVPLWVGEISQRPGNPTSDIAPGSAVLLARELAALRSAGIGWAYWAYGPSGPRRQLVFAGTDVVKPRLLSVLRGGL